ncbi:MAG TPA: POTRA domain-containing protein [Pyrinomonadaceae bacterium]
MKRIGVPFMFVLLGTALLCAPAFGQEVPSPGDGQRCDGPVYKQNEVSRKAVIKHKPDPGFTEEARANNTSGTVALAAVLCHTGRVTDIRIMKSLPFGLTEMSVAAASRVEFTPAEKDGRRVATHIRFEYNFNTFGGSALARLGGSDNNRFTALLSDKHNYRLVEDLLIEGNRRLRDEEIYDKLRTRPGDRFNVEQVQRDLQALLDMAFFDKTETRVAVEEGPRGGVCVIFYVKELPIIRDFTFKGLSSIGEADVLKALGESGVRVCKECPYDPVQIVRAKQIIRQLLAARGWPDATIEVSVEEISQVSVTLAFIVNERP